MKRTSVMVTALVALLFVAAIQSSSPAASIELSMVTSEGGTATTYEAPCPVYETYSQELGRDVYKIGYGPGDDSYSWETPEGEVILWGILDPDPMINFGGAAIDFGAPSNFSFTFILPLAPLINNPSIVSDSMSGTVINVAGAGVTVTALPPPAGIPEDGDGITEVQVYTLSDDNQSSWKNVGLDQMSTTTPALVGNSGVVGPFSEGPIATIAGGPWTHMRADINFRLTGGGDIFTFNGAKILVPEPGAIVLVLLSFGGLCASRRRPNS